MKSAECVEGIQICLLQRWKCMRAPEGARRWGAGWRRARASRNPGGRRHLQPAFACRLPFVRARAGVCGSLFSTKGSCPVPLMR